MAKYDGKFIIVKMGEDYKYILKASNGQEMFFSEDYVGEKNCRKGIDTIKKNALLELMDITKDKHGLFHFRIISKQGRLFGQSASYKDEKSARSAFDSFIKFVQTDVIEVVEEEIKSEVISIEVEQSDKGSFSVVEDNGEFMYQLKANNGRIIATSQLYKTKKSCLEALENFRTVVYDGEFKIFEDKNKNFQYKLYNKQNRIIMSGEVYNSKQLAKNAIESVKKFAGKAIIK